MTGSVLQILALVGCAILALSMQAGFAMVGTGFTRAKNAGHTMAMNMVVLFIVVLAYWSMGYAVRTGGGALLSVTTDAAVIASFLFQAVQINVAATIPIGAMAERWTFKSFLVYVVFFSSLVAPLCARWIWGGGWLSRLGGSYGLGHGVVDLGGSAVIHLAGGAAGLAGALVLGPRMGKFRSGGIPTAIPGHNIPLAVAGGLFLFLGWFGLNTGQMLSAGDPRTALVVVNMLLAASGSTVAALAYMWFLYRKPDLSLTVNGLLGGLVAISASCAFVSPRGAAVIGIISGVLCCASVFFVERRLRIDDPVGAISVHGTCGAWGMIAMGLFADGSCGKGLNGVAGNVSGLLYGSASQLLAQTLGVVVVFVFVFSVMYLFFKVLERFIQLRVAEEVEFEGLDQNEVSVTAYPDFGVSKTRR